MKYIKRINEGFSKKFQKYSDILRQIWFVSEEDLFNSFSEVSEEFDVEFNFTFALKSPKGKRYELTETKIETLESYSFTRKEI